MNAIAAGGLARAVQRLRAGGSAAIGRFFVIAVPYFWLALFFLVPSIVLKIAFSNIQLSMPPVEPVVTYAGDKVLQLRLHFSNFAFVFGDSLYIAAFLNSLQVAAISTVLALLIGYPMAYGIARAGHVRNILSCSWCCRSSPRSCYASTRGWACSAATVPSTASCSSSA